MTHACARATSETGAASGSTATSAAPAATKGTTWAVVVAVHSVALRRRRRSSTSGRQCTAARSGRPSGSPSLRVSVATPTDAARLPAGDRQAHDHELGVDRQVADLLGPALARRDHPEVALVEL